MKIENNILKHYLKNVYFITGTAYAGKSTTVKMLADRYDMIFCGELNQVNVNYTMFNKSGEPIRATVDIVIQQTASSIRDDKGGYWEVLK